MKKKVNQKFSVSFIQIIIEIRQEVNGLGMLNQHCFQAQSMENRRSLSDFKVKA